MATAALPFGLVRGGRTRSTPFTCWRLLTKVVRLERGRPRRILAGVRQTEAQTEEGEGDDNDQPEAEDPQNGRAPLDHRCPPRPERASPTILRSCLGGFGLVAENEPAVAARDGLVAVETEHRRQQRERRQHGQQDHEGRPERNTVEERQCESEHPQKRDADGQTGDRHRPSRGVEGAHHCLLGTPPGQQLASMAVDDEQGVVDADPQGDQLGQLSGELRNAECVGEDADERRPDSDGDDRGNEREQGAEQRPSEGEIENDESEQRSDQEVGGTTPLVLSLLDGSPTQLDVEDLPIDRLSGVDQLLCLRARDVLWLRIELNGGETDRAVLRDQSGVVGRGDTGYEGKASDALQHAVDSAGDFRVLQGARLRLHNDLITVAAL
jgi:hypothetical protein